MERDDEMGESIISERLRRLREEGEREQRERNFFGPLEPIPMPVAERARASEYKPVELEVEKLEIDRDGVPVMVKEKVGAIADSSAGAFEFLIHKGWIERKEEREGMGEIRQRVGFRFRSLVEDASVTPLKAQNYEGGGGGGGPPKPVGDHTIDCIKHIKSIERLVGTESVATLRAVLVEDARPWEGKTGQAVRVEVNKVLKGLDALAVYFAMLTQEEFDQRWNPRSTASARPAAPSAPSTRKPQPELQA